MNMKASHKTTLAIAGAAIVVAIVVSGPPTGSPTGSPTTRPGVFRGLSKGMDVRIFSFAAPVEIYGVAEGGLPDSLFNITQVDCQRQHVHLTRRGPVRFLDVYVPFASIGSVHLGRASPRRHWEKPLPR